MLGAKASAEGMDMTLKSLPSWRQTAHRPSNISASPTIPLPPGAQPPPPMPLDPLTCVLESLKIRCMIPGQHHLTAPWGLRLPAGPGVFLMVQQGSCWVELPKINQGIRLNPGELLVIFPDQPHLLKDQAPSTTVDLHDILTPEQMQRRAGLRHGGGGEETRLTSGAFFFQTHDPQRLLSAFPPYIHLPSQQACTQPLIHALLQSIQQEQAVQRPGSQAIADHLAHILFVQAIRAHLTHASRQQPQWLTCATDRQIGPVMAAIHSQPQMPWTVASLAKIARLSRSSFAARFTQMVGRPPLAYLLDHRMEKACRLLIDTPMVLKEIAQAVGYSSQASFANAFRRWAQVAPGAYRHQQRSPKKTGC